MTGPEPELRELRDAVKDLTWVFARTMPEIPHWYVVRRPGNEAVYLRLFKAIREHGQDRQFGRWRNRYLLLDDGYKYWAMTTRENASKIINRDRVLEPE